MGELGESKNGTAAKSKSCRNFAAFSRFSEPETEAYKRE